MSNIFCAHPFRSMQISMDGETAPCCDFTPSAKNTLDTYFTSKDLLETRQKFLINEWPNQCIRCKISEAKSDHSNRVIDLLANPSHENLIKVDENSLISNNIKHISVVTSNTCNLKCTMCTNASYVRLKELKKLGLLQTSLLKQSITYEEIDNITALDGIEFVTITGGEPFYDRMSLALIDKLIDSGTSKNIRIDINTNLTSVTGELMQKLKNNFKEVFIKGSIDGYKEVNEYIRYPSKWADITSAIDIIKEVEIPIVITTALSNLSLIKYYDLVTWAVENNLNDLFIVPSLEPREMVCDLLPNDLKTNLLEKYIKLRSELVINERITHVLDSCIQLCQPSPTDKLAQFKQSIEYFKKHDELRGDNLINVFPELKKYIDEK